MPKEILLSGNRFVGYVDDTRNAFGKKGEAVLSSPSVNVRITRGGEAYTRPGYEDTTIDLSEASKVARAFHVERWDVTFFCLNGKVKFVDHNNSDNVIDTGLSLTDTDGLNTRFAEYAGDIYLTNRTDGLRQIHMGRVNETSADSGDGDIKVDQHLAGRLRAFSDTTGTLRIANTTQFTEAYTAVAATGVITLTNTLDADVSDNTIVYTVEDISSNKPFGSGITFWKERMIVWGVIDDQNTYDSKAIDDATNVVYMSKFATRDVLENVIDFDTSGTATIEQVGKGGRVTNVIATRDYIYYFTNTETYFSAVADVNATTGATFPQLLSKQYGCLNEDSAADLGNGVIAFVTQNKRIIAIRIATDTGATIVFPDELFDQDVRNTLEIMDDDQEDAHVFYHAGERLCYFQLKVEAAWVTFVYDNNKQRWLPPDTNKVFGSYYEKDGFLYATDLTDDTIYQMNIGNQDEGIEVDFQMALGVFEFEGGRLTSEWKEMELSGSITQDTTIEWTGSVGEGTSTAKEIVSTDYAFTGGTSFDAVDIGSLIIGGGAAIENIANWEKRFRIAPTTYGKSFQPKLVSSGAFTWKSYLIRLIPLPSSLTTLE